MVQCSLSCIYLYPTNFGTTDYTARSLNRTLIFKRNIGHFDLSYTVKPVTFAELKEHKLSQQLRLNVFLKSLRIKEFLKSLLFPDVLCNRGKILNIREKKKLTTRKEMTSTCYGSSREGLNMQSCQLCRWLNNDQAPPRYLRRKISNNMTNHAMSDLQHIHKVFIANLFTFNSYLILRILENIKYFSMSERSIESLV